MKIAVERGRPRKESENLLIERLTMRLTERDRELLRQIAEYHGLAPESLIRSYALPKIREEHQQLFGQGQITA